MGTNMHRFRLLGGFALVCLAPAACRLHAGGPAGGAGSTRATPRASSVAPPLPHVEDAYALASMVALPAVKPIEADGLHNVFKLSANVISGSEPEGETAFAELQAMGVRTILSVDGKAPDAELAARFGLRYVHVPIEYKGLSRDELLSLAKTFRELEGPFYAHCFHGKHRGPAAAAVGRLVLDGVSREQALAEMRQWCGTAAEYAGLYRDVAGKELPSEEETRAFAFSFPARHPFEGLRAAMVDVARRHDALKRLAKRDWAVDPKHPDVDALNEATQLAQLLEQVDAEARSAARPDDFLKWSGDATASARELAESIAHARRNDAAERTRSHAAFAALQQTCSDCHAAHRNH